jgi:hypothetical protein
LHADPVFVDATRLLKTELARKVPKYYFMKFNELWRSPGLFRDNPGALSKFRQCISRGLQSGVVLTLLATNCAVANQGGNNLPYRECFEATAKTYNLDSDWLTAIAIVESSLNPKAVSSANAIGLMQIKWPQTAAHLGIRTRTALFDPCTNVDAGGRYLRELTDRYKGNKQTALAAYRIGPSALARAPSEPAVVLEYRRRINEQLDILRPASSSSYSNASAAVPAPSPLAKTAPVTAPNPTPVATKIQPAAVTTKTTEVASSASEKVVAAEPTNQPTELSAAAPRCDLRELQLQSLSTHHPAKREQRFFEWLASNGGVCSAAGLIKVKNQMAVWLGTAAGSKRINTTLNGLLSKP